MVANYLWFALWVSIWWVSALVKTLLNKLALQHGVTPLTALVTQFFLQALATFIIINIARWCGYNLREMFVKHSLKEEASYRVEDAISPQTHRGTTTTSLSTSLLSGVTSTDDETPNHRSPFLKAVEKVRLSKPLLHLEWLLVPFTIAHVAAHLTAQFALSLLPVWALKVTKATGPLWACLLGFILLRDKITMRMVGGVSVVCVGATLAAMGSGITTFSMDHLSKSGMALGLFSASLYAWEKTTAKGLFSKGGEDPYRLLIVSNMLGILVLFPIWFITTGVESLTSLPSRVMWALFGNGVIDSFLSIAMMLALQMVSVTTHQVAQAGERIFVLVGSVIAMKEILERLQWLGIFIVFVGVLLYGHARSIVQMEEEQKNELKKWESRKNTDTGDSSGVSPLKTLPLDYHSSLDALAFPNEDIDVLVTTDSVDDVPLKTVVLPTNQDTVINAKFNESATVDEYMLDDAHRSFSGDIPLSGPGQGRERAVPHDSKHDIDMHFDDDEFVS